MWCSIVATYPLDIVRTRLSIHTASFASLKHDVKIPGMWETMVNMYKHEGGFVALYRGLGPTLAGVAPYGFRPKIIGSSANLIINI